MNELAVRRAEARERTNQLLISEIGQFARILIAQPITGMLVGYTGVIALEKNRLIDSKEALALKAVIVGLEGMKAIGDSGLIGQLGSSASKLAPILAAL